MDDHRPKTPRWQQKRWISAAILLPVVAYPFSAGPVHYAVQRDWLPKVAESVDLPIDHALRGVGAIGGAIDSEPILVLALEARADYETYTRDAERLALRHVQEAQLLQRMDEATDPREKAALQNALDDVRRGR